YLCCKIFRYGGLYSTMNINQRPLAQPEFFGQYQLNGGFTCFLVLYFLPSSGKREYPPLR
ncbi:TPA: hypothetical protein ACIVL5_005121, partial [Salmonella enterica subsp. diarizonae serovar 61:r:-]